MKDAEGILALARSFLFVREVPSGSNAGRWVEAFQRIGGTVKGQPWCACFVCLVVGIWYNGKLPFPYTASCDDILAWARANGKVVAVPQPGDLFLWVPVVGSKDAKHVGFVVEAVKKKFGTIEGNAADPDAPPTHEGFGVFERLVSHARARLLGPQYVYVRLT